MTEPDSAPQNADEPSSGSVAALDRAFAILAAFAPGSETLTLVEIARRTGLYKSTILRLLGALEYGGCSQTGSATSISALARLNA